MPGNTLEVFRTVKRRIESELRAFNLTVKSAGFKQDELSEKVSQITGYWEEPQKITSKPPRLIIQFHKVENSSVARFAKTTDGEYFPSSNTIGYINNREGNCIVMLFRIFAAVKANGNYTFPNWEWIMLVLLERPLPAGNSSETISNFNPKNKTIVYQRKTFNYKLLGIIKTNPENDTILLPSNESFSYDEATDALMRLFGYKAEVNNDGD